MRVLLAVAASVAVFVALGAALTRVAPKSGPTYIIPTSEPSPRATDQVSGFAAGGPTAVGRPLIKVSFSVDSTQAVPGGDSLYSLDVIQFSGDPHSVESMLLSQHGVRLPAGSLGYLIDDNASRTAALVEIVSSNPDFAGRWYVPKAAVIPR